MPFTIHLGSQYISTLLLNPSWKRLVLNWQEFKKKKKEEGSTITKEIPIHLFTEVHCLANSAVGKKKKKQFWTAG